MCTCTRLLVYSSKYNDVVCQKSGVKRPLVTCPSRTWKPFPLGGGFQLQWRFSPGKGVVEGRLLGKVFPFCREVARSIGRFSVYSNSTKTVLPDLNKSAPAES